MRWALARPRATTEERRRSRSSRPARHHPSGRPALRERRPLAPLSRARAHVPRRREARGTAPGSGQHDGVPRQLRACAGRALAGRPVDVLNLTSLAKASKIIRCTDFNHDACGEDAAADARRAGYNGAWGENLYVAEGRHGSPRVALDGWLNSPHHRENLLTPTWRTQGIAVEKVDRFGELPQRHALGEPVRDVARQLLTRTVLARNPIRPRFPVSN